MSVLATGIREEKVKEIQFGREKVKLSLLADDMILYIKILKDAARKILEIIHEFGKVASYKINTQKSLAFLHTNNERSLPTVTAAMKFKRCLLLGRKHMTNLDSILKKRDITCRQKSV